MDFVTRHGPVQVPDKVSFDIGPGEIVGLVLDQPTSALDVSVQATVLQLLDKLCLERGIALLFVSHGLNVVRLLCSRIVVMYLGQVVESGPAE